MATLTYCGVTRPTHFPRIKSLTCGRIAEGRTRWTSARIVDTAGSTAALQLKRVVSDFFFEREEALCR